MRFHLISKTKKVYRFNFFINHGANYYFNVGGSRAWLCRHVLRIKSREFPPILLPPQLLVWL